jgi:hypothetical protein
MRSDWAEPVCLLADYLAQMPAPVLPADQLLARLAAMP